MKQPEPKPGILRDVSHSKKILQITADTMFLFDREGRCLDVVLHTDRWFIRRKSAYLGKRVFDLLPAETSMALMNNFNKVLVTGISSTDNYELILGRKVYFFKCIMHLYDNEHVLCQYRDITQRILLKQRLEEANHRLREIEKVAKIGHWRFDTKNDVFYYNGIFGLEASEQTYTPISKENLLKNVHLDDKDILLKCLNRNCQQQSDEGQNIRLFINGKMHYLLFKALRNKIIGGISYIEGYVQNISSLKHQQNKLEMVTKAVSNSTDYIFAMKANGDLVYGNQQFNALHGWDAEADISGYHVADLKNNWVSGRRLSELVSQVVKTNQIVSFVLNSNESDPNGGRTFDCSAYLTEDSNGEKLIWVFGKDITERIHYERQIKELNQIMSTVLSNIPMSISVKDVAADLKYIFSNKEGGDFRSGLESQIIGKTDYDIHPLELAESIRIDDLKVMQSSSETRRIIEEPDSDGHTRLIDQLRILIKDEIRPLILTIEQDVTKNKLMEQELVDAKERAIEADKLKSAFIANMSHEIRTPLNAIVGFSKIIAETDDAADRNTYFSIVEANNERLLGLINEILDLSKIESGIMVFEDNPIKMKDFSEDLLHTLSFKCPPGVELVYQPAEEELVLLCDRNRLSQVFINLIQNAIKFTSKGSITFGFTKEPSHLQFFVSDTGTGIPPEKLTTVFDRFVKADNFTQGTGLGLSICRSIVDRWGGEIWIESEVEKGSTFYFSFPYNKVITDATPEKIAAYGDISYEATNKTLLVAEDTDSNYKLIEAMIGKMYKLVRAHNGLEAVSLFNELHPDLILMDIKMPEMNGLDATIIIRESNKDVPILAQSAFAFEDDRRNAIEMGCTDFIAKPFSKKQLTTLIQRLLLNR